ncbi:hypothetical protein BY458DRAFT_547509 [Sporodiniella umbellata]|nr:hypothetical protein BY458DRAFT_547509 [Sporodiniella umbellata]
MCSTSKTILATKRPASVNMSLAVIKPLNLDGGQCSWCGKYGHKRPVCPLLNASRTVKEIRVYLCTVIKCSLMISRSLGCCRAESGLLHAPNPPKQQSSHYISIFSTQARSFCIIYKQYKHCILLKNDGQSFANSHLQLKSGT